jgi:hypothetical protein
MGISRLERMEEIVALDRLRENGSGPHSGHAQ